MAFGFAEVAEIADGAVLDDIVGIDTRDAIFLQTIGHEDEAVGRDVERVVGGDDGDVFGGYAHEHLAKDVSRKDVGIDV